MESPSSLCVTTHTEMSGRGHWKYGHTLRRKGSYLNVGTGAETAWDVRWLPHRTRQEKTGIRLQTESSDLDIRALSSLSLLDPMPVPRGY